MSESIFIPASLVSAARKEARRNRDREAVIGQDPYFGLVYREVGDTGGVSNLVESTMIFVRPGEELFPRHENAVLTKVAGGWNLSWR